MTDEELVNEIMEFAQSEEESRLADETFTRLKKDNMSRDKILSKIEDLKSSDIMRVLNASYIAERFFGKSKSWISQKLNHNIKNGTPAEFTPKEIETLRNALYTISIEIQEIADDLK